MKTSKIWYSARKHNVDPNMQPVKLGSATGITGRTELPFAIPKLRRFLGAPYVPMKRKAVEAAVALEATAPLSSADCKMVRW